MRIAAAQSGGPTAAINASLAGICSAANQLRASLRAKGSSETVTVLGAVHGIQGVIDGNFVDLTQRLSDPAQLSLLIKTPATALGSCRFRLPDAAKDDSVYRKVRAVLEQHEIDALFYIGGNDSMDTVAKLSAWLAAEGSPVRVIGVPKTIDNDLMGTDHTPGFGSAVKYLMTTMSEILRDCSVYQVKSVTVVEIMGRDAGWLTASTCLLRTAGEDTPDYIYLPESEFSVEKFLSDVREALKTKHSVVCAVSEGVNPTDAGGFRSGKNDSFGHAYLSGIGKYLEKQISEKIGCKVRSVELNIMQRCSSHIASETDLLEAEYCGSYAFTLAMHGETGKMVSMQRVPGDSYEIRYTSVPASETANLIRKFPQEWISPEGNQIKDDAVGYFLPLIQGEVYPEMKNGMPVHFHI